MNTRIGIAGVALVAAVGVTVGAVAMGSPAPKAQIVQRSSLSQDVTTTSGAPSAVSTISVPSTTVPASTTTTVPDGSTTTTTPPSATTTTTSAPVTVTVPIVMGLSGADASAAISAAGLVAVLQCDPATGMAPFVVAQSPGGGSTVAAGSSVSYTIEPVDASHTGGPADPCN